jgi:hypothetical protein
MSEAKRPTEVLRGGESSAHEKGGSGNEKRGGLNAA